MRINLHTGMYLHAYKFRSVTHTSTGTYLCAGVRGILVYIVARRASCATPPGKHWVTGCLGERYVNKTIPCNLKHAVVRCLSTCFLADMTGRGVKLWIFFYTIREAAGGEGGDEWTVGHESDVSRNGAALLLASRLRKGIGGTLSSDRGTGDAIISKEQGSLAGGRG